MQFFNQLVKKSLFGLIAVFALAAWSQAQPLALPKYIAGEHYQVLPNPLKVHGDDSQIEVMEIFWYGCRHCLSFEPIIEVWEKNIADDVIFARTPAVWQKLMRSHAALYYVAESLDAPKALHMDLFQLLIAKRNLDDPKAFAEVFAKHGISNEEFNKQYNSFAIKGKVSKGEKRMQKNYLSQGTPEVVVNGKYRVSARMAGGQAEMLDVVNFLIDLERKQNGAG